MQATQVIGAMHGALASYRAPLAVRDQLTDDQIEALTEATEAEVRAEALDDVKHDLRLAWADALQGQHQPNPPRLPVMRDGKLVMVKFAELLADLMDLQYAIQLQADSLRTGNTEPLHIFLRQTYVDGYCDQLVDAGWSR